MYPLKLYLRDWSRTVALASPKWRECPALPGCQVGESAKAPFAHAFTSAPAATPFACKPTEIGMAASGLISRWNISSIRGPRPSWSTCRPLASRSNPPPTPPNPLTQAAPYLPALHTHALRAPFEPPHPPFYVVYEYHTGLLYLYPMLCTPRSNTS